jgi:hypothetical protein
MSGRIPIGKGDYIFLEYLNQWLKLQQISGMASRQFDYWILGKTLSRKTPTITAVQNTAISIKTLSIRICRSPMMVLSDSM